MGAQESGLCYGEVGVQYEKFFLGAQNIYIVTNSCLMYPIMVIQS